MISQKSKGYLIVEEIDCSNTSQDIEDAIDLFTNIVKSVARLATRSPSRQPAADPRLRTRWMRPRDLLDNSE